MQRAFPCGIGRLCDFYEDAIEAGIVACSAHSPFVLHLYLAPSLTSGGNFLTNKICFQRNMPPLSLRFHGTRQPGHPKHALDMPSECLKMTLKS